MSFSKLSPNEKPSGSLKSLWSNDSIAEFLFLAALISMFFPVKIYPAIFLISCVFFHLNTPKLSIPNWSIALGIFSLYAVGSFIMSRPEGSGPVSNIIKLLINFSFLFFTVNWLKSRDNKLLIERLDWALGLVLVLSFFQLLVYHQALDFKLLTGSVSSGQASSLYREALYYWGLEDKNMFGSRIALLGFCFVCIPIVTKNRISLLRILAVFLLAFLSLSRTPIVALLIGVFLLIWISVSKKWKIVSLVLVAVALPFILQKLIRFDSITSSNDGMGIRLVYWKAFFSHFREISPLGNGFGSAPEFLGNYAEFYRGEPHIHNTFLTTYLELGIVGFFSYLAFFFWYIADCWQKRANMKFWILLFLPLLSIMMILYSGYDNDLVMYLSLAYLIGSIKIIDFQSLKFKL
jgi:O-antigen ligase